MNLITKTLLMTPVALSMGILSGCNNEACGDCGGGNAGNGLITQDNAVTIAKQMMAFKDFHSNLTSTKSSSAGTKASAGSNKLITTTSCGVSGSYSYDDVTSTMSFDNCDDGFGTVDGTSSSSVSGSVTSSTMNITMTFGDALINMAYSGSVDSSPNGAYDFDIDMSFTTSAGSLSIITDPAFMGTGLNPPSSGTMTITGPDGGKIQINANLSYMEVKADTDGDNFYEYTFQEDWNQLGY